MAMHIGKALLHYAKEAQLQLSRKPAHLFGHIEANFDPAALAKPRHVPGKNTGQTELLEQWRMEKVRDCADLGERLIDEFRAFLEVGSSAGIDGLEMLPCKREVQFGHGKQLARAIVQIAPELTPLFIPQIQEMTGDNSQLLLDTS